MPIYVYIGVCVIYECALVHTYIYLHIHSVLIGDSLYCILCFKVRYHCTVIYTFYINREVRVLRRPLCNRKQT